MVFSSLKFIFVFLPVFLVVYFLIPKNLKNFGLLIASLIFYAYGTLENPLYIILLALSVMVNYFAGIAIINGGERRKTVFICGVLYNLVWLFVFKYAGFFMENLQTLLGFVWKSPVKLPEINLVLPLGISFYTFQSISYIADIYMRRNNGAESLVEMATYLCMFPKLTSGPIVRYGDMQEQIHNRKYTLKSVNEGLKTFTLGLGLKVVLANQVGKLWTDINAIGFDSISTPLAWMGIIAYSLQLYFDFYGYSLMAMGLGEMIGFKIPDNFNDPYMATSMTDFWRRWHITLGAWFREYVYIPLGGNRRGSIRMIMNLIVVWLLTGLWHGASWNFVIWGAAICLLIIIEKLALKNVLDRYPVIGHLYMIVVIPLSWLVFALEDLGQLKLYFMRLFGVAGSAANVFQGDYMKYGQTYLVLMLVGIFFCTGIPVKLYRKYKKTPIMSIILLAVFWMAVYCLYMGMNDPFMYFVF